MLSVIAWKEWRQQVAFVIAIFALAGIMLAISAHYMPQEWARRSLDMSSGVLWVILLVGLAIAQGVVTGTMLFAGETEDCTQDFLDQHAALRAPIWRAKMWSGASLVVFSALVLGGLLIALDLKTPLGFSACMWFALDALVWSAACSVRRKTTFGAIGVALAVLLVVAGLPLSLAVSRDGTVVYLAYFSLKIPLLFLALAISWWLYSAPDWQRIRDRVPATSQPWPLPKWLQAALWLFWARRKGTLALLVLGPIAVAHYSHGTTPLLAWPIGTFLLGCVAGWSVFAEEQATGAERFLGDQRFPRVRLWLGRTLPPFTLALLGTGVALILSFAMQNRTDDPRLFLPFWAYQWGNPIIMASYAFSFVVLGFGIAQFAVQQTRKMPVAIFLTLGLGTLVAALWYPSIFAGLPAWRAWMIPVVLSLATLWLLPRWTSGRLYDRGGIARLSVLLTLLVLWLAGNLWWRGAQHPDPGEPFDTTAYRKILVESPDDHGADLREAGSLLKKRLEMADDHFSPFKPDAEEPAIDPPVAVFLFEEGGKLPPVPHWRAFREEVFNRGLPKELGQWSEYLDFVFADEWASLFKKAALSPPDRFLSMAELELEPQERNAALYVVDGVDFFLLRFLIRARAGQQLAALDDLEVALAAIRHGLHRCGRYYLNRFLTANRHALFLVDSALDRAAADADFRARLGEILARHDEAWPDFADIVKSDYFAQTKSWAQHLPKGMENAQIYRALIDAPWERVRFQGLRNRTYAVVLAEAEAKRFPPRNEQPKVFEEYFGRPPFFDRDSFAWNVYHLYQNPIGLELLPLFDNRFEFASNWTEIRCLRLALAAVAYEADQGRPIESLEDLVPRYFKTLPQSPLLGGSFSAYASDEHEQNWVHGALSLRGNITVPGQVVIIESISGSGARFAVPLAAKK